MSDIFISYKRENLQQVQRIVQALRGGGLSVWWDQDIAPDAAWEATIERELEVAKVVIVAWSQAAAASENVKAEARRARNQGKLIQVFVEPCDPPLFFGERQGVDLSNWNGDPGHHRFQAVIEATRAILAGKRPPQGVGYAPKKRAPWAVLTSVFVGVSAVLGFVANLGGARDAVCSIAPLGQVCLDLGPVSQPPSQVTREGLLESMNGLWGSSGGERCDINMRLAVTRGGDGVYRVRASELTGDPDYGWSMQVLSVDTETRNVTLQGEDGAAEYRYRIEGDRLTVTEPPAAGETLARTSILPRCG